jgi:hypothetical protein
MHLRILVVGEEPRVSAPGTSFKREKQTLPGSNFQLCHSSLIRNMFCVGTESGRLGSAGTSSATSDVKAAVPDVQHTAPGGAASSEAVPKDKEEALEEGQNFALARDGAKVWFLSPVACLKLCKT